MTVLLPQINKTAVPPKTISHLTKWVKKHLSSNKAKNEIISPLFLPMEDSNVISTFCSSAGITVETLHSEVSLSLSPCLLTNQLIYDLEKYRQNNHLPQSDAVKWNSMIFYLTKVTAVLKQLLLRNGTEIIKKHNIKEDW